MQKPLPAINFINQTPPPASAARKNGASDNEGAQFSQALKREVSQRQESQRPETQRPDNMAPKPARSAATDPAMKQAAVKADKADKVRQAAPAEQARKVLIKDKQEHAAAATTEASAAAAAATTEASAAAAAAAMADAGPVNPMVDMLALVASFNQPQQATAQVSSDKLAGAGAGGLESQLAALQNAAGKLPGPLTADSDTGSADGKFSSMFARTDGATDAGAATGLAVKPELLSKAGTDPQARAGVEPAAMLQRSGSDIPQIVRRADAPQAMQAEASVGAPLAAAVQQASLTVAQAVNAAAGDKIAARVGTPGWDTQVAQKIIYMVGGQDMSASLTLNPPDLGPMQVVLNVNNDHASIVFSSAEPEVRQALEDALPKLRDMMSESGIALGNASVNDGAQQQAQEQSARGTRGNGGLASNGSALEAEAQLAERPTRPGELPGLVNTFA